jgi:uncharacterized protein (AIM24 family)
MSHPADWYPDPAGDPTLLRWWDGNQWTEHTQPVPVQQPPAPAPADPAPAQEQPGQQLAEGDMVAGIRSELLTGGYSETSAGHPVVLQNSRMLRVRLGEPFLARQGAMVAFQGQVDFDHEGSGGMGKFLKKAATGEGVPLMRCTGQGDVFLARHADQVHILHLDGSAVSINGRNVLAFQPSLEWDIQRVQGAGVLGGGLFNTRLSGTGWIAITTHGQPMVLHTDQPTFADPQSVVMWSANLQTSLNKTVKAKSLVGMGSGEAFQVAFQGHGIVVIQPSEGGVVAPTQ